MVDPAIRLLALGLLLISVPAHAQFLICIDAGHGGTDPGAVGCGMEEADIVLDVSQRLAQLVEDDPDLSGIMTRDSDVFVSLAGRSAYANNNGADRFASIHANAFNGAATGIETYHATVSSAASVDQANAIQAGMVALWPELPDRGVKSAGFSVLVNTSMPATLSELAFLDNCSADAVLLADPAERQKAAEVHHQALRESLGLGGGGGPTPSADGQITGVVFEDQGVGTADMSIRLTGATVTVEGSAGPTQSATAASEGLWSFPVAAGTWKIVASLDGFQTQTRTCTVISGETTWCSIGLFPDTPEPELEPEPQPEPGPPETPTPEPQPDAEPVVQVEPVEDAGPTSVPDEGNRAEPSTPSEDAGAGGGDAGGPDATGFQVDIAPSSDSESEGCATGRGTTFGLLMTLVGILLLGRRRLGALGLMLLAVIATPLDTSASEPARVERVTPHNRFVAPVWSPDGGSLVYASRDRMSLWVSPVSKAAAPRRLVRQRRSGVAFQFSADGRRVGYLSPEQHAHAVPALAVDLLGRPARPIASPHPRSWLIVKDDAVFLVERRQWRRISPPNDRFFEARRSPDGAWAALSGLVTGIRLVHLSSGTHRALGSGTHPRFSHDSRSLVFERTEDNGSTVTRSTLFLVSVGSGAQPPKVIDGLPRRARRPSFSPDGRHVAFDADGAIWRVEIPAEFSP